MSVQATTSKFLADSRLTCKAYDADTMRNFIAKRGEKVLNYRFKSSHELGVHTPLYYTVMELKDIDLVRQLLELGANVDEIDPDFGGTALHAYMLSLLDGTTDLEMLKLLLGETKNINAANNRGFTPLHLACHCFKEHWKVLELLLIAGADPYAKSLAGETPCDLLLVRGKRYDLFGSWKKSYDKHVQRCSTVLPEMATEAERHANLKALSQEINDLARKVFIPAVLPNPLSAIDQWHRQARKDSGLVQLKLHADSLACVRPKIAQLFSLWQKIDTSDLPLCFTDQEFTHLQQIFRGDFKVLAMIQALKEKTQA